MQNFTLPGQRILILVGNYGSGKTEISIHLAKALRAAGEQVTLVDLDIVNPYFRSSGKAQELTDGGIKVIAPNFAHTGVDVPSLPAEVQSVFADTSRRVIFDVGGDDTGATVLGRYKPNFDADDVLLLYVVNAMRPLSGNADDVCALMERIAARSRLSPGLLINNTNLATETTAENLSHGDTVVREVSARTGVPIGYLCATEGVMHQVDPSLAGQRMLLNPVMRPDWM